MMFLMIKRPNLHKRVNKGLGPKMNSSGLFKQSIFKDIAIILEKNCYFFKICFCLPSIYFFHFSTLYKCAPPITICNYICHSIFVTSHTVECCELT